MELYGLVEIQLSIAFMNKKMTRSCVLAHNFVYLLQVNALNLTHLFLHKLVALLQGTACKLMII